MRIKQYSINDELKVIDLLDKGDNVCEILNINPSLI